jgi:DNA-binding SARP family transcriptional activator
VYGHGTEGVSRDRLIWLMWEVDDEAPARHRLSQLLYAVSRRVGPQLFVAQDDHVLPNPGAVDCDLWDLNHTKTQRYLEAATLVDRGLSVFKR